MDTAQEIMVALTRRYSFREVAALIAQGAGGTLTNRHVGALLQLCAFGQRLIDLDAEDFGEVDAATDANVENSAHRIDGDHVPEDLRRRALACRMPQSVRERHRGAMASLKPVYRLLLEVLAARHARKEMMLCVSLVHIASEYAPLLAWEQVLGHAGDPLLMPASVGGEGSAWGDFDAADCAHTNVDRSAARRCLRVAGENTDGWRAYLDRQHSNTAHALGVCASGCRRQCTVYTRLPEASARTVSAGSALAQALAESPVVRLRHSAPVGHGFGVPSPADLDEAWTRTRRSLARLVPAIGDDDGYPLAGFATLVSSLAGADLRPDTLLADTAERIEKLLLTAA